MSNDDSPLSLERASKKVGPYVRGSKIGNGAMADVYEAEDTRTGALVALKVLKANLTGTSEGVSRFIREGRALQRINHHRIIRVFDHDFTETGDFYIAMERLRGVTLDLLVRDEVHLDPVRTTRLGICIAEGLAHIHDLGIVHRDIKPENIFVVEPDGPNEGAKLFDFGLARLAEADLDDNSVRYTVVGRVMGSAAFMSPEQAVGGEVDARTDVYALSCVLYEMLTGRLPFDAVTIPDAIRARTTSLPLDIRRRVKGIAIPKALATIIMAGLEKDPAKRIASGADYVARLRAAEPGIVEWFKSAASASNRQSFSGELDITSSGAFASLRAPSFSSMPAVSIAPAPVSVKTIVKEDLLPARRPRVIVPLVAMIAMAAVIGGLVYYLLAAR